ncbi:DUF4239 domain-containing protein [Roseococcus sp. YIM B11640]|uniref:bestrophin-like domain n=1 Tax=Roseococcus sp. YIM B11640 TaxID=3133973 RepID=UPI003C7C32EB
MSAWLVLTLAVIGSALGGCLVYTLARLVMPGDPKVADLANLVIVRVGIIHALIVALAFAEVKTNELHARRVVAEEAVTVSDTFYDLERYDLHATDALQRAVVRYASDVVRHDWPSLAATGRISAAAWASWSHILNGALDLQPEGSRQELIHKRLIANIYQLEDQRQRRELDAQADLHPVFWVASVVGLIIMCACLGTYPPRRSTYLMIAVFAGFTGAVVYLAYDVTTPFAGLWIIQPSALLEFLQRPDIQALSG